MRQITVDEAITELKKRHASAIEKLDSPVWRANHGGKYSYTMGRADALDEALTLLETNYH